MAVDLNMSDAPTAYQADVCVVGAGAAGVAIARALAGTRLRVLVMESGGPAGDASAEDLNACEIVGLPFLGHELGRARGLGGTTTAWHGQSLPLDPIDFEHRDWAPHSGWPFQRHALDEHYVRAERMLHLSQMRYNDAGWSYVGVTPPPFDPRKIGVQMSWLSHRRDFAKLYGAELNAAQNVTIVLNATAVSVDLAESGEAVERIVFRNAQGATATARAKHFVLAVGGVETPRLLLSSTRQDPRGVGNAHDVVGRFFQDHPTAHILEIEPTDEKRFAHYFRPHNRRHARLFPKVPLAEAAQRAHGVLNATAGIVYTPPTHSGLASVKAFYKALGERDVLAAPKHAKNILGGAGALSRGLFQALVRRRSPTAPHSKVTLLAHIEQSPNWDSRITLSETRDRLGTPRAKIDWRLTELDRRTFDVFAQTVGEELERTGLARAQRPSWLQSPTWTAHVEDFYHHIGTARMGEDPRTSVVDPDLRVHGLGNLFIASSAVFPTGGASNPTLTIIALALRLADFIKGEEQT